MPEKVYCKDCENWTERHPSRSLCKVNIRGIHENHYAKTLLYEECQTINSKNDCRDFKPKLLFRLRRMLKK